MTVLELGRGMDPLPPPNSLMLEFMLEFSHGSVQIRNFSLTSTCIRKKSASTNHNMDARQAGKYPGQHKRSFNLSMELCSYFI